MKRKNRYLRMRFSTILWSMLAILLYRAPALHAGTTVPAGETWDIDYPVTGVLYVDGIANLLTGASAQYIYVQPGGTLNMYSGTVGDFICVNLDAAGITVYGTDFAVSNGTIPPDGRWTPEGGMGTLTGYYGDGSPIYLLIFSDTPINLQPLPPEDPVTMLDKLALFIQDKVASGEIDRRLGESLLAKVNVVANLIQKGSISAAIQKLEGLVNFVEKQPDKKISPEARAEIIQRANAIIAVLGG